jgi:hypothetical protein
MSKIKIEIVAPLAQTLINALYDAAKQQVLEDPSQDLGEVMSATLVAIGQTMMDASGREVIVVEVVHCKEGCPHCKPDPLEPKSAEMEKIFNSETVQ